MKNLTDKIAALSVMAATLICGFFAPFAEGATKPFVYDTSTGEAPSVNRLYRDFYIYVDMSPSPSTTQLYQANPRRNNVFYYEDSSGTARQTVSSTGAAMPQYIDSDTYFAQTWWSDFEVKAIDKYGNNIYFSSTIYLNSQTVVNGHSNIIDKTPKIYYFSDRDSQSADKCYGSRTEFTNFNSSIGATITNTYKVSGVWLYPSLNSSEIRTVPVYTGYGEYAQTKSVVWGEYIREIFTDPENLIIVWRQTTARGEEGSSGRKRWRVVTPVYYGEFKVKN